MNVSRRVHIARYPVFYLTPNSHGVISFLVSGFYFRKKNHFGWCETCYFKSHIFGDRRFAESLHASHAPVGLYNVEPQDANRKRGRFDGE